MKQSLYLAVVGNTVARMQYAATVEQAIQRLDLRPPEQLALIINQETIAKYLKQLKQDEYRDN